MEKHQETSQNLRIVDVTQDSRLYAAIADQIDDRQPRSGIRGNAFEGCNKLLLAIHAVSEGFESDVYFTRTQIRAAGASVKKGQRSARVFAYNLVTVGSQQVRVPAPYSVWNAEQLDNLPEHLAH